MNLFNKGARGILHVERARCAILYHLRRHPVRTDKHRFARRNFFYAVHGYRAQRFKPLYDRCIMYQFAEYIQRAPLIQYALRHVYRAPYAEAEAYALRLYQLQYISSSSVPSAATASANSSVTTSISVLFCALAAISLTSMALPTIMTGLSLRCESG